MLLYGHRFATDVVGVVWAQSCHGAVAVLAKHAAQSCCRCCWCVGTELSLLL